VNTAGAKASMSARVDGFLWAAKFLAILTSSRGLMTTTGPKTTELAVIAETIVCPLGSAKALAISAKQDGLLVVS